MLPASKIVGVRARGGATILHLEVKLFRMVNEGWVPDTTELPQHFVMLIVGSSHEES